jgi:hypothetical protein
LGALVSALWDEVGGVLLPLMELDVVVRLEPEL